MFTQVDKALVAAVMAVAFLLNKFGGVMVPEWFTADWVATMIGIVTPILVYFIPNKK